MAKIEEKGEERGKEFKQALRSSEESLEELKQELHKLFEDPEKYADNAMILAARETVDKLNEITRSHLKDRSEKRKEMTKISDAFRKLYSACEPYLSDGAKKKISEAKKKISEILETEL